MACDDRKEALVSLLYGEIDADAERELRSHLADCEPCRNGLEQLAAARRDLDEARPVVPEGSSRVVVLGAPAPIRRPWLAFAAGFACAVLLLAAGIAVGATVLPGGGGSRPDPLLSAYAERLDRLEKENEHVGRATVSRQELDEALREFGRVLELRRATDVDVLRGEIQASEFRTHDRIGQTQEAVQYVLLASDPRLSIE